MVKFGGLGLRTNTLPIHLILVICNNNHGNCAAIAHLHVMPTVSASVLLKAFLAVLLQTQPWSNLAGWGSERTRCKYILFWSAVITTMVTVLPLHTYTSCQLFPQVCCSKLSWLFSCRPSHGQIWRAGAQNEHVANPSYSGDL